MTISKYDPLAQLAEHLTFNQGVRSSNLRWITTSEQASYRLLRLFCKSQSALILLLLLSKSQPLTLGCDLGLGVNLKAVVLFGLRRDEARLAPFVHLTAEMNSAYGNSPLCSELTRQKPRPTVWDSDLVWIPFCARRGGAVFPGAAALRVSWPGSPDWAF